MPGAVSIDGGCPGRAEAVRGGTASGAVVGVDGTAKSACEPERRVDGGHRGRPEPRRGEVLRGGAGAGRATVPRGRSRGRGRSRRSRSSARVGVAILAEHPVGWRGCPRGRSRACRRGRSTCRCAPACGRWRAREGAAEGQFTSAAERAARSSVARIAAECTRGRRGRQRPPSTRPRARSLSRTRRPPPRRARGDRRLAGAPRAERPPAVAPAQAAAPSRRGDGATAAAVSGPTRK